DGRIVPQSPSECEVDAPAARGLTHRSGKLISANKIVLVLTTEVVLPDLARCGIGQLVNDNDVIRQPPFRHARAQVSDEFVTTGRSTRLECNDQQWPLVPFR